MVRSGDANAWPRRVAIVYGAFTFTFTFTFTLPIFLSVRWPAFDFSRRCTHQVIGGKQYRKKPLYSRLKPAEGLIARPSFRPILRFCGKWSIPFFARSSVFLALSAGEASRLGGV